MPVWFYIVIGIFSVALIVAFICIVLLFLRKKTKTATRILFSSGTQTSDIRFRFRTIGRGTAENTPTLVSNQTLLQHATTGFCAPVAGTLNMFQISAALQVDANGVSSTNPIVVTFQIEKVTSSNNNGVQFSLDNPLSFIHEELSFSNIVAPVSVLASTKTLSNTMRVAAGDFVGARYVVNDTLNTVAFPVQQAGVTVGFDYVRDD